MGMEGEYMGWGFGLGWIFMIAIWVLIGYLVFAMLRFFVSPKDEDRRSSGDKALEILDQRYARGEISHDEYLRMKRDITHGDGR